MPTAHAVMTASIEAARLCAWLLVLAVIFLPLERLFALHPRRVFRKAIALDLAYFFLSSLLPGLVLATPLALLAAAGHHIVPAGVQATIASLPFWQRAAISLLVGEIGFYWGHRWSHEIPWLWRCHAIHHSAEHLDFLVHTRAHPADMVFTRLVSLVPLYMLGLASPSTPSGSIMPVLVTLAATIWGFFIHANIRWRLGPLEWLIATPAFHHWHHARAEPWNKNYASMLPWLDRIFGTHHLPRAAWPDGYGLQEPIPATLAGQLAYPLTPPPLATAASFSSSP